MILPKDEIKFVFNPYVLLPGDILLMNTYEEGLRKKMGCKYEHVAIYIGDAQLMEANGAHVVMNHIYSYAFREQTHACVLRFKNYSPVLGMINTKNTNTPNFFLASLLKESISLRRKRKSCSSNGMATSWMRRFNKLIVKKYIKIITTDALSCSYTHNR